MRTTLAVPVLAAALALSGCASTTEHWPMPNLVGQNLQDAQNRLQDLGHGSIETSSHDATPADREQTVDRDWKVCQQSVKPGDQVSEEDSVDFVVVRNEEKC
jgi:beta-lactam-binding protein with PASTA domain